MIHAVSLDETIRLIRGVGNGLKHSETISMKNGQSVNLKNNRLSDTDHFKKIHLTKELKVTKSQNHLSVFLSCL